MDTEIGGVSSTKTVQITTDKSGPKLICPICFKQLTSLHRFVKHTKKHEAPGGFCCNYCEDRFCLDELLKKHIDEKHKVLACRICHETFSTALEYRTHIKDVHGGIDRPMSVCDKCGTEFKTPEAFKRHTDTQCGQIKPHPCDECNMAFYTKYNLAEHKKIHKGEKKYCCIYCGKGFLNNGRLQIHERSHTGEKPYKCDVCGKCFAHRESIVTHSTIHTGIKLVVCKCCGARFSCHSNLIKHRRARPDTCGQAIFNSTNERNKTRVSRIPAGLMTSEIKIIRASRVINEQKKPAKPKPAPKPKKEDLPAEDEKEVFGPSTHAESEVKQDSDADKITKEEAQVTKDEPVETKDEPEESEEKFEAKEEKAEKAKVLVPIVKKIDKVKRVPGKNSKGGRKPKPVKHNSDSEEEVIIKRPRRSQRLDRSDHIAVEVKKKPPSNPDSDFSDDFNDPIFEMPNASDDDSSEEDFKDIKPTNLNTILAETSFKLEEEQNASIFDELSAIDAIKNEPIIEVKEEEQEILLDHSPSSELDTGVSAELSLDGPSLEFAASTKTSQKKGKPKFKRKRAALRKKLRLFKKDRTYECNFCMKVYQIRRPYEKHLVEQHNKTDKEIRELFKDEDNDIPSSLVHRCPICSKVYLMAKRLRTHITFHGPDGSLVYKCPCYCNLYFCTKDEALEHAKVAHKASIYCDICDKYTQSPDALKLHKRNHASGGRQKKNNKNLMCDKCAKPFASRTSLNDHTRSNCGKDPLYQCDICDKKFTTAGILKTHSLLHKDDTPYVCDKCGKAFKISAQYKTHMKFKHTDLKPFKCELCSKEYPYRESLLTHMAVHTGIKRYSCDGCSKRFTCISNLQAHRKVYADTCGLTPLNSKPSQYIGMQKGSLLMGTKPTF